jgi:hypothetical protein
MKKLLSLVAGAIVLVSTSGCIVAPARHYGGGVAVAPGPVYVEPTYASPGVGFVWELHPRFGWGWHHPGYGWHRGWR